MVFSTIPGLNPIKKKLFGMFQDGNVPHAQLFAGPQGSASLLLALACITYLHCHNKKAAGPCGACVACTKLNNFVHPDLHCAFPVSGKGQATQSDLMKLWRSFLQKKPYGNLEDWGTWIGSARVNMQIKKEQVCYLSDVLNQKSFERGCKTILVWLPEQLHPVASNALLKMVEEPSPHTFFFFVSVTPHFLLPTLRSRLCPVYIPPFSNEALKEVLLREYPTDEKRIKQVVKMAQGDLNLAHKMMGGTVGNYFKHFTQWLSRVYGKRVDSLVKLASTFYSYTPQERRNWVLYGLQLLRMALFLPFIPPLSQLTEEEFSFCTKFNRVIPKEKTMAIMMQLSELGRVLTRYANPNLAFMNTSLLVKQLL